VTHDFSGTAARRLSVALLGAALIGAGALAAPPAASASPRDTAAVVIAARAGAPCIVPTGRATKWRQGLDTERVSHAMRREAAAVVASASPTSAWGDSARRMTLPSQIVVPVIIHVIHGRHRGEHRISKRAARRMYATLRAGYAGAQDPTMAPTGVRFVLRKITVNRNERWFHAAPFSRADRQMKTRLHRGKARVLNIYVNRPRSGGQLLLGYSLFPWQHRAHRKLDGVTVRDVSLPGGRARGYNLGDTVIHETGHWLGLLHTFEGSPDGCSGSGDGVADTPAEASASFACDLTRNTCHTDDVPDPADPTKTIDPLDPINNFMDYSFDACMYQFTPLQNERMIALFMHYRYGRR
jgi:hypothetical protein